MESDDTNNNFVARNYSIFKKSLVKIIPKPKSSLSRYALASFLILLLSFLFFTVSDKIGYQTVSLLFLFAVTILPLLNFGPGPVFLAALLSALSWNYFFIPPLFTFHIARVEDGLMFFMYFLISSVSGYLTSKIRTQQMFLRQKEERTSALYTLAKELSTANNIDDIVSTAVRNIQKIFTADVAVILHDTEEKLKTISHKTGTFFVDQSEWHIANWVYINGQIAGRFTNTLSSCPATFYPLKSKSSRSGVLGIRTKDSRGFLAEQENLLETFITQIADAFERENLNIIAQKSMVSYESEKLYKTLFNSISHELKTPITTIIGAVGSLNDPKILKNDLLLNELQKEIDLAANRLNRLVENLLDMARLESGNLKLKLDWHSVSDLINSIMNRTESEAAGRKIILRIQDDLPLFKFDFGLIEQALLNVLHNSLEYSPSNSEILIEVRRESSNCIINISDKGKGFPEETLEKLFDKFYRIPGTKAGGTGLGLSISKGFIEAHGGTINASNRASGGAVFSISIPFTTDNRRLNER